MKIKLLFTQDGLLYQISKSRSIQEEKLWLKGKDGGENGDGERLGELLRKEKFSEISVVSSLNHFTLMPEGFSQHELGYELISLNAPIEREKEELMLSVNKKYGVQFYYAFPNAYYHKIKELKVATSFTFSGDRFLNLISEKGGKEIHINLYHNQCEFFALENRKVMLYNNLDVNSEVDFLYFIMFTLSKIGFGLDETQFYVYGETTENETFIAELRKFAKNIRISFDNVPKKNFLLNL